MIQQEIKSFFYYLILGLLVPINLYAQNTAGIYKIRFIIDQDLTNEVRVNISGETTPDRFNVTSTFPNNLIDSIHNVITKTVAKQLASNTSILYKKNRKGQDVKSYGSSTSLEGMPRNRLKKAILAEEKDFYVRVRINFSTRGGIGTSFLGTTVTNIRPVVIMKIVAFSVEKKRVYSKKVRVRDFSRLRAVENTIGSVSIRRSEVLLPIEIYTMLERTVEEYEK
jgi:hypothetical protein